MLEGYVRNRRFLALVAATYIFFHSELKNSCCLSGGRLLQKYGLGKFPSHSPMMKTVSHSSPFAEWIVEMVRYPSSVGMGHSRISEL